MGVLASPLLLLPAGHVQVGFAAAAFLALGYAVRAGDGLSARARAR